MSKTKQNRKTTQDEVPTPVDLDNVSEEQNVESNSIFVVTRGGIRVSENEYSSIDSVKAIEEKNFWQKIINKFPDGSKIEIVPFDKKKHRIW